MTLTYLDVMKHGILFLVVLIDGAVISYIPVRFRSIWPLILFNLCYLTFNVIHSFTSIGNPTSTDNDPTTDDDAIYAVLNWNKRPYTAAFWAVASNVIIFPLMFFIVWAFSTLGGGCRFDASRRRYTTGEIDSKDDRDSYRTNPDEETGDGGLTSAIVA
eukprot:CAMPEP_0116562768 /NCGR_PEP_ID=MMETSP0397-20121206/12352_1 /TAXON_ID=216820 /ORGANISM="Cyclophora tenuis, Strain ECT3854" /LENGTH=158 /DNA_ID=CAMNT_0004089119 /DNA_START=270 /DNA_END=746 /DNA_ORIENTATION=+